MWMSEAMLCAAMEEEFTHVSAVDTFTVFHWKMKTVNAGVETTESDTWAVSHTLLTSVWKQLAYCNPELI